MVISLFESAERSTFMHETGYFFLEVYRDLAALPDTPQQMKDDFAGLLKWMPAELHARWLAQKQRYLGRDHGVERQAADDCGRGIACGYEVEAP